MIRLSKHISWEQLRKNDKRWSGLRVSADERLLPRKKTAADRIIEHLGVPVAQKTAMAGDIFTYYFEAGSGKNVILLHGSAVSAVYWHPVLSALSRDFHIIAPDIAGFGNSEAPRFSYDGTFFTDWLNDFFVSIGLQSAALVGHSLGGAIALEFAIKHPEKISRMILINSAGLGKGRIIPGNVLSSILENIFPSNFALRWAMNYTMCDPERIDDDTLKYMLEQAKAHRLSLRRMLGMFKAARPIPYQQLSQVSCPVLIIWGKEDPVLEVSDAIIAASVLPNAHLEIIAGTKHHPLYDQVETCENLIDSFLLE